MKIEFINARYVGKYAELEKSSGKLKSLPKTVFLGSSVQFLEHMEDTRIYLESLGKSVVVITGKHSSIKGQILGCDIYNPDNAVSAEMKSMSITLGDSCFLIISTGEFHALSGTLAGLDQKDKAAVFSLNPITGEIRKIEDKFSIKGQYLKFLDSRNIGIIITTKPGQHDAKDIADIDIILKRFPDKKFYKIISDNINPQSLADFNYIDFFINTACPRMIDEKDNFPKGMINIRNLIGADIFYNGKGK